MKDQSKSRRPIASRDTTWAKKAASWLAKNNISPNFISILSIVFSLLALLAFYLVSTSSFNIILLMVIAIIGIQGRLVMNLLDGMVAVEYDKKSPSGGLFNEVPDRISDSFIILGVGLCAKQFAYGMDLAYLAIILSITTAYIRCLGASLNGEHYFSGPMAKQHRMALISVGCVVGIAYPPIFYYLLIAMNIGLLITCFRRLSKISNSLKNLNS